MLPCTMALGATLPLAVDALPKASDLGGQVARLYSANLAGSAFGALSASALLLASLGIEFSIRAAAIAILLMALVLLGRTPRFSIATGAVAGSAILLILALDPSAGRAALLARGRGRFAAHGRLGHERVQGLLAPRFTRALHCPGTPARRPSFGKNDCASSRYSPDPVA
jgi:hypothetical protein